MNEHETGQLTVNAAQIYEEFFVPALFAEWPARLLQAAGVQAGDDLLDVACGTGVLAREASTVVGAHGSVTGIDVNKGMLDVAREKAPDIIWKAAPAEALPFANDTFDRVLSQFALMFFDEPVRAVAEMVRVLRPGGRIAVAVWASLAETPGYATVAEILEELFGAEVARSIQAPYALGDKEKLATLFKNAGVEPISIRTLTGKARFDSIESWIYTDIKGWTLADVIDDAGYERLRQYAPQKLARFVRADGTVAFDAPAHIVTVTTTA